MTELKLPEVNRMLLSGRLTRDPENRFAPDGTPVTQLDIAFHRRYRARDGKVGDQTGYVSVMTYERLAEVCAQYLRKGNAILAEGRLQMREWTGPQGSKRQRLEIRAEAVHFLERAPARPADAAEAPARSEATAPEPPAAAGPHDTSDEPNEGELF